MLVTDIQESWFFIYSTESSHLQLVEHDATFCKQMLSNLEVFFKQFLALKILSG